MRTLASTTRNTEEAPAHRFSRDHSRGVPERDSAPPVSSFSEPMIQRKASCACDGGCPGCQAKSSDLKVSQPNDPAEIEADQVAGRVMRMSEPGGINAMAHAQSGFPMIQAKGASSRIAAGDALSERINSSRGSGNSLDRGTQSFLQSRLGDNFSSVKIHTDAGAVQMNRELRAKAFTVGDDIYFNEAQYQPNSASGRVLLAHEVAHTLQQRGAGDVGIQKEDDAIEVELIETPYSEALELHNRGIDLPVVGTPPPVRRLRISEGSAWSLNGRRAINTKRAPGFTGDTSGTHISRINIQINPSGYSTASLRWANMGNSPGFSLPASLRASPGAGNCPVDCSDITQSQTPGSHCTPLSPPDYVVQGFSPRLGSYPTATFVTWFHYDRAIAFHYYNVPSRPESHGCVRLDHSESGAEWIYDNSLPGITTVTVSRDASLGPGSMCWRRGRLIPRPRPRSTP